MLIIANDKGHASDDLSLARPWSQWNFTINPRDAFTQYRCILSEDSACPARPVEFKDKTINVGGGTMCAIVC
jgi:hypothetical protein